MNAQPNKPDTSTMVMTFQCTCDNKTAGENGRKLQVNLQPMHNENGQPMINTCKQICDAARNMGDNGRRVNMAKIDSIRQKRQAYYGGNGYGYPYYGAYYGYGSPYSCGCTQCCQPEASTGCYWDCAASVVVPTPVAAPVAVPVAAPAARYPVAAPVARYPVAAPVARYPAAYYPAAYYPAQYNYPYYYGRNWNGSPVIAVTESSSGTGKTATS